MRFEICETVHGQDPEMVLRALEVCSRDVSSEVVRYGHQITLHGLGPSPRARNVHDTTVFSVNTEDDKTIINAEVNFQASALLGTTSQYDVVRSKIDRLFEQMKTQLDIEAMKATVPEAAEPQMDAVPEPSIVVELPADKASDAASGVADAAGKSEDSAEALVPVEPELAVAAKQIRPMEQELRPGRDEESSLDSEGHSLRGFGIWLSGLVALGVLAVGGYFFYQHHHSGASVVAQPVEQQTADMAHDQVSPIPDSAAHVVDPKVWLQDWAAAMRTRDATVQASFYADTVDRYLRQRNVSRADVLKDRAATIHIRQGAWTVKMEKIVVEQQSDSEVQIRLVKHFIDEAEPDKDLEWFVPSKLTLKRVGTSWKISSEQDLPASSPTFEDAR